MFATSWSTVDQVERTVFGKQNFLLSRLISCKLKLMLRQGATKQIISQENVSATQGYQKINVNGCI